MAYYTPDELREIQERQRPGPGREDFEDRGYRDLYPNAVQDPRPRDNQGPDALDSGGGGGDRAVNTTNTTSGGGNSRDDALRRVQEAYTQAGIGLDAGDVARFRDPSL